MCKILLLLILLLIACNSKPEKTTEIKNEAYSYLDVLENDSLVYLKSENVLFSGSIIEKDSTGRILMEITYKDGKKHGQEIRYEYFYTDLPVVVLEGTWANGKKAGIWKSHDGEGQMTIIKNYDKIK